jgi:hypothetical protein
MQRTTGKPHATAAKAKDYDKPEDGQYEPDDSQPQVTFSPAARTATAVSVG